MSDRSSIDRILDVLDNAGQQTSEPAYGDYDRDRCWRCGGAPGDGASGVCDGCRDALLAGLPAGEPPEREGGWISVEVFDGIDWDAFCGSFVAVGRALAASAARFTVNASVLRERLDEERLHQQLQQVCSPGDLPRVLSIVDEFAGWRPSRILPAATRCDALRAVLFLVTLGDPVERDRMRLVLTVGTGGYRALERFRPPP